MTQEQSPKWLNFWNRGRGTRESLSIEDTCKFWKSEGPTPARRSKGVWAEAGPRDYSRTRVTDQGDLRRSQQQPPHWPTRCHIPHSLQGGSCLDATWQGHCTCARLQILYLSGFADKNGRPRFKDPQTSSRSCDQRWDRSYRE